MDDDVRADGRVSGKFAFARTVATMASGMTPVEIIQRQFSPDHTTDPAMTLLPGLPDDRIAAFEERLGFSLDPQTRELLRFTGGIQGGPLPSISFDATDEGCALEEENTFSMKTFGFATDGEDGHWAYILTKQSRDLGPICFVSHKPSVFLYQAKDLGGFLAQYFDFVNRKATGETASFTGEAAQRIWLENPGAVAVRSARLSPDTVLAGFAKTLRDHWSIMDLRSARPGDGFSWGRCRDFIPHGSELLFGLDLKSTGAFTRFLRRFTDKA